MATVSASGATTSTRCLALSAQSMAALVGSTNWSIVPTRGSQSTKTLTVPSLLYSESTLATSPGLMGRGSRASPSSW